MAAVKLISHNSYFKDSKIFSPFGDMREPSSPNRIRLQSKPHPTAVQTASDCSPNYGRLAEGLELPHVKPLCFKTLFPTSLHIIL